MRPLRALMAVLVLLAVLIAPLAPTKSADVNVYTTPGEHTVNGRKWRTTCEPYSKQITRCRAEIWATQVQLVGGKYVSKTGWVFNNLTYLPVDRAVWAGNPLAKTGTFTSAGRQWKTSCADEWTGPNGCRSFIWSKVIENRGGRYVTVDKWVFNNLVTFSPSSTSGGGTTAPDPVPTPAPSPTPTSPSTPALPPTPTTCNVVPSGFAITNGMPHSTSTPYKPATLYNPTSISSFIFAANTMPTTTANKTCWITLAANTLIKGSTLRTVDGVQSRWYPYMFAFSANPAAPMLQPGWISGLAQGGALAALATAYKATGNPAYLTAEKETFESYFVDYADGGFHHELDLGDDKITFFEEYPTGKKPTTVLNGHNQALLALNLYWKRHGDQRAKKLFDSAVADYAKVVSFGQVDVEGGIASTYDLVRGYTPAPLRMVSLGGTISSAKVNNGSTSVPVGAQATAFPTTISNGAFSTATGWTTFGSATISGGSASYRQTGSGWSGISRLIPAGTYAAGTNVALQWDSKVTWPSSGPGTSPRVAVYQSCNGTNTLLTETQKNRGTSWSNYGLSFTVKNSSCGILIQFLSASYANNATTVAIDNVTLRQADWVGTASVSPVYDFFVFRTPTNSVTVTGNGAVALQAYTDGRWKSILQFTASSTPRTVTIPERFTGRNIHLGYHDHAHIGELTALAAAADPASSAVFTRLVEAWRPFAPSQING